MAQSRFLAAARFTALLIALTFFLLLCTPPTHAAPDGIVRDEWGVPHITADTIPQLFHALGYATTEDRLVQLDISRRRAYGELAEIGGEGFLHGDIEMRRLNLRKLAERDLARLAKTSPDVHEALLAYAQGINDFIAEEGLPPEYFVLPKFEPWLPVDTLAIAALMHVYLSGDHYDELGRLRTRRRGGDWALMQEKLDSLAVEREWHSTIAKRWDEPTLVSGGVGDERLLGSNAFVVSGDLTADGRPIVAGDPHLDVTFPGIWYEIALEVPGKMRVRGITVPGTALVAMGETEDYAWAITALQADNEDILIVPKESVVAVFGEELTAREETISIRDGLAVRDEVAVILDSPLGPVVEADEDSYYILHWTGFYPNDEALGYFALNSGRSLDDFQAALVKLATPCNFVYADASGNIAYFTSGLVPRRDYDGNDARLVTTPEQAADYRWEFIPFGEMPHAVNPSEGFLVTCNNPPALTANGLPVFPGNYAPGYRARRISNLILEGTSNGKLAFDDIAQIQLDVHSSFAEEILPPLLSRLRELESQMPEVERKALDVLSVWDYEESAGSQGAPLYELMRRELTATLRTSHCVSGHYDIALLSALQGADWISLSDSELSADWRGAFYKALSGGRLELPAYGEIHRLPLVSPLPFYLSQSPGMLPASGGYRTVNVSAVQWDGTYLLKSFGPTARLIMTPGATGVYWSVLPGGNSGRPESPHWADQVALFLDGEYKYRGR
jgi:penicillin amidase